MSEKDQKRDRPIYLISNKMSKNTRQRLITFTKQKGCENII